MSAEVLRRAAALMRERAQRAEARRWYPSDQHDGMDEIPWWDITGELPGDDDDPINEFVDSWHPAVALAVADWLDGLVDAMTNPDAPDCGVSTWREERYALAIARTYLGEGS